LFSSPPPPIIESPSNSDRKVMGELGELFYASCVATAVANRLDLVIAELEGNPNA
jgi:hypothetical protein